LPKKVFRGLKYDGRDKSFFFFNYEHLKDIFPEPDQFTVPPQAERGGDFSALLAIDPSFQLYNPFTARLEGARIRRDPFPGNIIPQNMISPVARAYLRYYPLPNQAGDSQGRNNFISAQPRSDDFHSESYRFDQSLSDKQKFFFRYTHNNRRETRMNWSGMTSGLRATGTFLTRKNDGFSYDHTYAFSRTVILDARVGFSRFTELARRQHEGVFDPASLGFSTQSAALFGDRYLPRFDIGGFSPLAHTPPDPRTPNLSLLHPT